MKIRNNEQVYRIIKTKELRTLYFPYHSLDNSAAIERILGEKGAEIYRTKSKKSVLILFSEPTFLI